MHCPAKEIAVNHRQEALQPEATGAVMEVTIWLKPSGKERHELVTARGCRPQREYDRLPYWAHL